MRIESGSTTRYIYFVAVDATDLKTRETGLSSFTVRRSRNGGASAAMTTPTINETDTANMPGVYELLIDEDTTIAAGNDSEEMVFHITHAGMAPVTRVIELYRPKITAGNTLGVTSGGNAGIDWGNVANAGTTVDLSATSINLCDTITTYTGNTVQTGDSFARLGAPAGASISADIAAVDTVVDGIKAVTDLIPDSGAMTSIATAAALTTVDTVVDGIKAVTDLIPDSGAMTSIATAAALATVDANVDTLIGARSEPAQGAPNHTLDSQTKIDWLYKFVVNKRNQTSTIEQIFNSDGVTVDHKRNVSDDTTTATKGEVLTGP